MGGANRQTEVQKLSKGSLLCISNSRKNILNCIFHSSFISIIIFIFENYLLISSISSANLLKPLFFFLKQV